MWRQTPWVQRARTWLWYEQQQLQQQLQRQINSNDKCLEGARRDVTASQLYRITSFARKCNELSWTEPSSVGRAWAWLSGICNIMLQHIYGYTDCRLYACIQAAGCFKDVLLYVHMYNPPRLSYLPPSLNRLACRYRHSYLLLICYCSC